MILALLVKIEKKNGLTTHFWPYFWARGGEVQYLISFILEYETANIEENF